MNAVNNINVEKIKLSELEKTIKIPKFQRHLVWKDRDKKELLKSIIAQKPIGTLIVWQTNNQEFLIDGLQRFSTIKLLRDKFYFYVDFEWLIEFYEKKFQTKIFAVYKKAIKKFLKEYKLVIEGHNRLEKNSSFVENLNNLFDSSYDKKNLTKEFKDLYFNNTQIAKIISDILEELEWNEKRINEYDLICIYWKCDNEEEVIDGFEKLNSQGKKLSNFDLLFAKWSSNLKTISWELKSDEKDLIETLYKEKNLEDSFLPIIEENKLTCPEIIWLMIQKGSIFKNSDANLLSNILKKGSKNEKIYLFSFLLVFAFYNFEFSQDEDNNDINEELKQLKNKIQETSKEKIINLAENFQFINQKITKNLKFIHTPDTDNPRNIKKHNVKEYPFLIIYAILLRILGKSIFENSNIFLNQLQNNQLANQFLQKLDWEILQILCNANLKSSTNKNAYSYIKKRVKELKNKDYNLFKEWNEFEEKLNLILSENNSKDNFPNFFVVIQLINSYKIDETTDEFRGYHLDHLIPKSKLNNFKVLEKSDLGNLSIIPSVRNMRKKDEINEVWFKLDYINKDIKKRDEALYHLLIKKYNSLPGIISRNSSFEFTKAYKYIITERRKWILKYFKESYLKI